MPTIGEQLRLTREKQGRSISELATATCISSRYLQAIESDDRKSLPGDFFYRNFVKQYASALSIDSDPLVRELDRLLPKDDEDVLPVLSTAYQPTGKTVKPNRMRSIVSLALLVLAIGGGSAFYAWWEKSQRKEPAQMAAAPVLEHKAEEPPKPQPEPAKDASVQPPVTSETPVNPPAAATPTPAPATTSAPVPAPASTSPVAPGTVTLAATEKTWVSVTTNGKTVFAGILEPTETRRFEGVEHGKLITGNAAGLDVEWNGKAIGPIGPRGQVRTVLFTGESYEILGPGSTRRM
jgi:cytoskeleton protein RodZ